VGRSRTRRRARQETETTTNSTPRHRFARPYIDCGFTQKGECSSHHPRTLLSRDGVVPLLQFRRPWQVLPCVRRKGLRHMGRIESKHTGLTNLPERTAHEDVNGRTADVSVVKGAMLSGQ
jgi:hypothetical protein